MSLQPLSQKEPSIQESSAREVSDSHEVKHSLAHYFSTIFVVFIGLLLISTMILFIWSNTSDGAWVSLQVTPIVNNEDATWLATIFSFISLNANLKQHGIKMNQSSMIRNNNKYQRLDALTVALQNEEINDLNVLQNSILNIDDFHLNENIFHFSLISSVTDFWQSRAYTLAIIIALFSGIWPYVKLILLLFCWFFPMKQIDREGILIFLDQLGKFSFIDLFVSLYMIVSFYVNINEEIKSFGVNLKVVVEPDIGLNTFVIGTVISMIFSHFFLYLDAKYAKAHMKQLKLVKLQQQKEVQLLQKMEIINNNPFFIQHTPQSLCHVLFRSLVLLLILCTIYGCFYTVYAAPVRYNITGLVGLFVSNPVRAYSPLQIVKQVPSHTDQHTAAPALALTLFVTIILFPILLSFVQFIIWFIPISRYGFITNYLNVCMQICMSWSSLDVFAVASIAASLELQRVSQWIINQNYAAVCGDNGLIAKVTEKIFDGQSIACFSVDGYLIYGTWILCAVAISLWINFIYTIHQLHKYKLNQKKSNASDADKSIFFFDH